MNKDEFDELAAGHALNALSIDDEHRFVDALAAHPEWQETVDQDATTAAALADAVTQATPPPHVRAALLDAISRSADATVPADAAPTAAPRRRRTLGRRGVFALAASLVLLLAVGIGGIFAARQFATPPAETALAQIQHQSDAQSASVDVTTGGTMTAHWSSSLGEAVLVSDGVPQLADDKTYEMWFVRDSTPVSAGLFTAPDGDATAALDGSLHAGDSIAVTVEPSGGSPTGQPTTTPIAVIPTT